MIRQVMILGLAIAATTLFGCDRFSPDAGHEIVLTKKPLIFGVGGIDPQPVKAGSVWGVWTTQGTDIDMQPLRFNIDIPDAMTSDGVPIAFHTAMSMQVTDSVRLVSLFGPKWYENNVEADVQSLVRQSVRTHGMNETAIQVTAIDAIDKEIRDGLVKIIETKKLPVQLLTLTVGKANPPDSVKDQRIATAAQQQRIQTENQRKLAEDGRWEAEKSRARADNAYREAMNLSPEQFVQLETVKLQTETLKEVCGKHDPKSGSAGCTFIQGGTTPVYNLGK